MNFVVALTIITNKNACTLKKVAWNCYVRIFRNCVFHNKLFICGNPVRVTQVAHTWTWSWFGWTYAIKSHHTLTTMSKSFYLTGFSSSLSPLDFLGSQLCPQITPQVNSVSLWSSTMWHLSVWSKLLCPSVSFLSWNYENDLKKI